MRFRVCTQCDDWGDCVAGWCRDCWRAFWKGASAAIGAAIVAWLFS